jgi:hypothetical protein
MNADFLAQRVQLLEKMATLDTMEEGTIKAEYRTSKIGGQSRQVGPYFKHQVWLDGRNVSQRIPADQAPALEEAIAHRQQFEQLAAQFTQLTITHTRQNQVDPSQKKRVPPSSLPKSKKSKS